MLFNSYEFICLFLPLTVAVYFLLGRTSRAWALGWVIAASLFFYAWWRPFNLLIIAPAILVNFALARLLQRWAGQESAGRSRTAALTLGIIFNVSFLGYFKYANFGVTAVNDIAGTSFVLEQIVLPLGISFITFQKIAFLIDVHAGRVEAFGFKDYCLFVLFFPQLIAGPIVHYRELMPQFRSIPCRFDAGNVTVGLTLFSFGLFKKVYLADGMAPWVSAVYGDAEAGRAVTLLPAWVAAVGFTLQIYFDFSGYTDMALGSARLFGVRLPPNFDSPLRASSIIDFWLRWHMTLTRFLTAYIYNPLALALTRRRVARGGRPLVGRQATPGAFLELLAFPTILTMFVSGVWHGAGYLFIIWGLLHGVYLTVNHAWRLLVPRLWPDRARYVRVMQPIGFVVTLAAVVVSMVVFRATTVAGATDIYAGMLGLNGIELPSTLYDRLGPLAAPLGRLGVVAGGGRIADLILPWAWIALLGLIALACPNTLQVLGRHDPALGWKGSLDGPLPRVGLLAWRPSLAWAVAISLVVALGMVNLGGQSEFLYWQF
jgi:D-alanyl-lipoteichoic acid acyltransferase DltB (MBOAT superfamily)